MATLFGRESKPLRGFRIVPRYTIAIKVHQAKSELSFIAALFGRESKPLRGLGVILGDSIASEVHEAKVVLAANLRLFGCESKPLRSLHLVLRYAKPFGIHEAEIILGLGAAMIGRQAIPLDGLLVVRFHSLTVYIQVSKAELRVDMAILGRSLQPFPRFQAIGLHTFAEGVHDAPLELGFGVAWIDSLLKLPEAAGSALIRDAFKSIAFFQTDVRGIRSGLRKFGFDSGLERHIRGIAGGCWGHFLGCGGATQMARDPSYYIDSVLSLRDRGCGRYGGRVTADHCGMPRPLGSVRTAGETHCSRDSWTRSAWWRAMACWIRLTVSGSPGATFQRSSRSVLRSNRRGGSWVK